MGDPRAASDSDHSDGGHSAFGEERSQVVDVTGEEGVIWLAHEGESGVVDIVSSGGGKQQSRGLGEFDGEGADVDAFECLSEARLTRGSPPNLPDYPGVGHDLLFGLVCDGEACPHGSVVPVEGDEGTGVEDQSAHAAEEAFFLVRRRTVCFRSASVRGSFSASENASNSGGARSPSGGGERALLSVGGSVKPLKEGVLQDARHVQAGSL